LEVEGTFTDESGGRPARLDGRVYFEPYLVNGRLCMMEAMSISGLRYENGYDWTTARFTYSNWQVGATGECSISARSLVPDSAVKSSEPIPSATLAYVLINSHELLALAYRHVETSIEEAEPMLDRILDYAANGAYRLERIAITKGSSPEYGFAYEAMYRAPEQLEGPVVVFSVTPSGFVVHSVSLW